MKIWDLLLSRFSNNGKVPASPEDDDDEETTEDELTEADIQNIRRRLKKKATDPIIPRSVKERMTSELNAGAKEVSESSQAVQQTMRDIDKELDARCPGKEAPA